MNKRTNSNAFERFPVAVLIGMLLLVISVSGCNMPNGAESTSATPDVTSAYQTVAARLTEMVADTPSPTSAASTDSGLASSTPSPTVAQATLLPTTPPTQRPAVTSAPASNCDQAAPGTPIDVTIPDDTRMQPGQSFTKIWRLENAGTCTWSSEYQVFLFSGDAMAATGTVNLGEAVAPGESIDIAVDMTAPQTAGTYQGNWKLRNASGNSFGIGPNGSSPFWVRILVVATTTATASPTATATSGAETSTPTATTEPTPEVAFRGPVNLQPGQSLDLDTGQVSDGSGQDLMYISDEQGRHPLVPSNGVSLALVGSSVPSYNTCVTASLSADPVVVELTPQGSYVCFRTDAGRHGYLRLGGLNQDVYTISLDLLTWAQQ